MNLIRTKLFEKQLLKCNDAKLIQQILSVLQNIDEIKTISELRNCKKMKGSPNAYRIKIGSYRIGFYFDNDKIEIETFEHRKDIYKNFP